MTDFVLFILSKLSESFVRKKEQVLKQVYKNTAKLALQYLPKFHGSEYVKCN